MIFTIYGRRTLIGSQSSLSFCVVTRGCKGWCKVGVGVSVSHMTNARGVWTLCLRHFIFDLFF